MTNQNQKNQIKIKYNEAVFSENTRYPHVNRDCSGVYSGRFGRLFIVARGIGGDGCEVISHLAVMSMKDFFEKLPEKYNSLAAVKQAFTIATKEVLSYTTEHTTLSTCCASVAILLINISGVYIAHAGDCRVMLIRDEKISNLTEDHFSVKEISEFINSKQSLKLPIISNTIGLSKVEPEILEDVKFQKDDTVLIMSKGVYQRVARHEMLTSFDVKTLSEGMDNMWYFARNKRSNDDFTIIGLKILKVPPIPIDPVIFKKEMKKLLMNIGLLLVSLIVLFFTILPMVL